MAPARARLSPGLTPSKPGNKLPGAGFMALQGAPGALGEGLTLTWTHPEASRCLQSPRRSSAHRLRARAGPCPGLHQRSCQEGDEERRWWRRKKGRGPGSPRCWQRGSLSTPGSDRVPERPCKGPWSIWWTSLLGHWPQPSFSTGPVGPGAGRGLPLGPGITAASTADLVALAESQSALARELTSSSDLRM